jgi:hypothetical protein
MILRVIDGEPELFYWKSNKARGNGTVDNRPNPELQSLSISIAHAHTHTIELDQYPSYQEVHRWVVLYSTEVVSYEGIE